MAGGSAAARWLFNETPPPRPGLQLLTLALLQAHRSAVLELRMRRGWLCQLQRRAGGFTAAGAACMRHLIEVFVQCCEVGGLPQVMLL